MWSFGIVISQSCGQTRVSSQIAGLIGASEDSVRQRLREWCWDKKDKAGQKRTDFAVDESFAALLKWVLSLWPEEETRLVLAMDATTLKESFAVLAISLVYRGCAIPIAWKIMRANQKKAWKEEWLALFSKLEAVIPSSWLVIVLADRGLYADWLFARICKNGWHPFLRINQGGKYRLEEGSEFRWLSQVLPAPGRTWSGKVVCFKNRPLPATLLASWSEVYQEPWLILTDLSPDLAEAGWYSMRAWIECGFKHTKRAGWQWQKTRMTDPERASRLWLALAVATLWAVTVGGEVDASFPVSSLENLPVTHIARRSCKNRPHFRRISCFRRGLISILSALLSNHPLPFPTFHPVPWPSLE